jgi:hypothetical protein
MSPATQTLVERAENARWAILAVCRETERLVSRCRELLKRRREISGANSSALFGRRGNDRREGEG